MLDLVQAARSLGAGEVLVLFQVRLNVSVGGWDMTGDADIIRLERRGGWPARSAGGRHEGGARKLVTAGIGWCIGSSMPIAHDGTARRLENLRSSAGAANASLRSASSTIRLPPWLAVVRPGGACSSRRRRCLGAWSIALDAALRTCNEVAPILPSPCRAHSMRRRSFLTGLTTRSQPACRWPRVGAGTHGRIIDRPADRPSRRALAPGHAARAARPARLEEGRNLRLRIRPNGFDESLLVEAARELVQEAPDVIVAGSSAEAVAALSVTKTIPVLFGTASRSGRRRFRALARPARQQCRPASATNDPSMSAANGVELLTEIAPATRFASGLSTIRLRRRLGWVGLTSPRCAAAPGGA